MTFVQVEDFEIVEALWHLLAPNSQGDGGFEQVNVRALLAELKDRYPGVIDGSNHDRRELVTRCHALQERNRVVVHPSTRGEIMLSMPKSPEDGMYRLILKGEKHTYSLRGSQEHDAKATANVISDLMGFRADYIEALFIAPLNPGKSRKIKREMDTHSFIVERAV